MKPKFILPLLLLSSIFYSCSKQNNSKQEPDIDDKNLTTCAAGAGCSFLFTEQADFEGYTNLKAGTYRVFWSVQENSGITATLYIKAPMPGKSFELTKNDILAGKIQFNRSCPSCYMAAFKPVDGYVKGINITPDKPADQTKWLVEAKIFLQANEYPQLKDTVFVKQYFSPNFVMN
ncbi:hypothetical protein MTO98_17170 [Mucilaginibacter sp. SMC90]|uniref:hypothetical protein n=1 Tax=Mucilaginibacter sp. SMC90 TaxID=2929803 RepID=UPI001FB33346|nr:hypothetical protein [Mucilaginibacter sp. SMC90]UOE52802.1 hypothetical protein MTO98_17170 [Mucilaginibacter sp. SMC90]